MSENLIAVDTETTGLEWWGDDWAFLATTSDAENDKLFERHSFVTGLANTIQASDGLIFHNAAFDIHFLSQPGLFGLEDLLELNIHDTALLSRIVVSPEEAQYKYGLKHLAKLLLGEDSDAEEVALKTIMMEMGLIKKPDQKTLPAGAFLDVFEYNEAGRNATIDYALKDTRLTFDLFYTLMERATPSDLEAYEVERQVLPHLVRMEDVGIGVDTLKAKLLQSTYQARQADAYQRLMRHTSRDGFDPDSNDQVAEVLIGAGVPLTELTDTGKIRVDQYALGKFEAHDAVQSLLEYRTTSKFLSTYIDQMTLTDRIHPSIWSIGAKTRRMSCTNPNMQNIPVRSGPEVREVLIPGKGNAFVVCDYGSIELRILAYHMNDDKFTELVQTGLFFEYLGEMIYKTPDQDKWPVSRSSLKNGTYALTYGAGGPRLAATIGGGMTPDQGRALARQIKKVLGPQYSNLTKRVEAAVHARGDVKTMFGTHISVPRDKAYTGLNYLIQGAAATIMKLGLINAAEAIRHIECAHLVLPVHDELVTQCHSNDAEQVQALIVDAMCAATDKLELVCSSSICYNNYSEGKN